MVMPDTDAPDFAGKADLTEAGIADRPVAPQLSGSICTDRVPSRVRMAVIQAVLPFSKSQPELVATCATLRMTSVGLLIVREAEFSPSTPPRLSPHAYRSPSCVRQNR